MYSGLYPLCGVGICVSWSILIIADTSVFVKVLLPYLAEFYFLIWHIFGSGFGIFLIPRSVIAELHSTIVHTVRA